MSNVVSSLNWKLPHPALAELLAALHQTHSPVYVVGGVVRDLLLKRKVELTDVDLVLREGALSTARSVADQLGWAYYPLDETRDVARLVFMPSASAPLVCDIAGMRGGSIEADLQLRDFTVNAMALAYTSTTSPPTLIDTVGGQRDLEQRFLRRVSAISLADDPVRLLRAVRLANQFAFAIEPDTAAQLRRLVNTVQFVSAERIRDELWKLMLAPEPDRAIEMLHVLGLLAYILPGISATVGVEQSYPHLYRVFEHTLNAMHDAAALRDWIMGEGTDKFNAAHLFVHEKLAPWRHKLRNHLGTVIGSARRRADWFIWYVLFHDVGKPQTRSLEIDTDGIERTRFFEHESVGADLTTARLSALRFNRNEIDLASSAVRAHMRPHHLHMSFVGQPISNRAMFRFFRDVGGKHSGIGPGLDAILVALADRLSVTQDIPPDNTGYIKHLAQLLHYAFEQASHEPLPLVDGHLLMSRLAMKPGPHVGALMEHLMEAQAAGEISTTDEALTLASAWLEAEAKS